MIDVTQGNRSTGAKNTFLIWFHQNDSVDEFVVIAESKEQAIQMVKDKSGKEYEDAEIEIRGYYKQPDPPENPSDGDMWEPFPK